MQTNIKAVLFVRSPSPGAVFRLFERRRGNNEQLPTLLLSEPLPPHGWRVLTDTEQHRDFCAGWGGRLSEAFGPRVVLLYHDADSKVWGFILWESGSETEHQEYILPPLPPMQAFLSRLPGIKTASPLSAWAKEQGLPLARALGLGQDKIPMTPYRTVATLDERNLLVENSPRWYQFPGTVA